ncbi:winged helix-turn-helix transcriptional regulator [Martelella radicis]|uniref:DNA-binding HxlR family transcriptional regulator n=1 Tax=Martelella radicis TaxID=1397476 RepID=A0A7W6KGM0_9HYPH|nr:helix-turn-helix domain-containing protein [Martelella radicis]MBB4120899.1 DNA-binding HxlR family transcriptional regulator [Martelella radicis]
MRDTTQTFTCGLHAALALIGSKWKPLILNFLGQKTCRYGELRRSVRDASDKVLIQHLKELEADGLILRTDFGEVPPRVEYSLTPFGASLVQTLEPLCAWGEENRASIEASMSNRKTTRIPLNHTTP